MKWMLLTTIVVVSCSLLLHAQEDDPKLIPNKRNLERMELEGDFPRTSPLPPMHKPEPDTQDSAPVTSEATSEAPAEPIVAPVEVPTPDQPAPVATTPRETGVPSLPDVPLKLGASLAPPENGFLVDSADIMTQADEDAINEIAHALLVETGIPLYVVSVRSLEDLPGRPASVERAARDLYNRWGIGHAEIEGQAFNKGILLLIARDDRQLRIELGAGFAFEKDEESAQIVDTILVPHFRQGECSTGILAASRALSQMAREQPLDAPPVTAQSVPVWVYLVPLAALVVGLSAFSFVMSGRSGWAWLFWGAVLGVVGLILFEALKSSSRSSRYGSGSFGGGGFGGGFSGGGGASGRW